MAKALEAKLSDDKTKLLLAVEAGDVRIELDLTRAQARDWLVVMMAQVNAMQDSKVGE